MTTDAAQINEINSTDINLSEQLIEIGKELCTAVDSLSFSEPVAFVYNPLNYAWEPYSLYLRKYGNSKKRVIFLGMNPGPWGMAQVGVPFGEIDAVKNWLQVEAPVYKPKLEHPKRPIEGFQCKKSEVSGKRLWGLFKQRFKTPENFFEHHFVANYCPLAFMEVEGKNRTPDKLKPAESKILFPILDWHLKRTVEILKPEWLIGVGNFTEVSAKRALAGMDIKIGHILHPSPLNPDANRNWAGIATHQLTELGVW